MKPKQTFQSKLDIAYRLSESLAHNQISLETHLKRYVWDPTNENKYLVVRAYRNIKHTLHEMDRNFTLSSPSVSEMAGGGRTSKLQQ